MLFDLRALGYFVAAFEERSVTAAARRCHVAQPSISMAIKGLEDALGVRLFIRSRRGLEPTPDADRLHPRAVSLLAQSQALVQDFRAAPGRSLNLHLPADVPVRSAAPLLALLTQKLPGVVLHLVEQTDRAHLRLTAAHCRQEAESFVALWQEPYVMLVPQDHGCRFKPHFTLQDLHGLPLIERPYCDLHLSFKRLLATHGVIPDVRATAQSEEQLLQLVELGLGLAVVPRSHAGYAHGVVVKELDPALSFERHMGLACAAGDETMLALIHQLAPAFQGAWTFIAARRHPPQALQASS